MTTRSLHRFAITHILLYSCSPYLQLRTLLSTLYLHNPSLLPPNPDDDDDESIRPNITVIYSPIFFADSYKRLSYEYPDVTFQTESTVTPFPTLLRTFLTNLLPMTLLTFLVDDIIFLEPLPPLPALFRTTNISSYHLRLSPYITHSQTLSKPSSPPVKVKHKHGSYLYTPPQSSPEWSLPFDLTGGTYRVSSLPLANIPIKHKCWENPNRFESSFPYPSSPTSLRGCPCVRVLTCLTINIVQTTFSTPCPRVYDPVSLDSKFREGLVIDPSCADLRDGVHTTTTESGLRYCPNFHAPPVAAVCAHPSAQQQQPPPFTILIPLKDTPIRYCFECARSILSLDPRPCSVLLVDDGDSLGGVEVFSSILGDRLSVVRNPGSGLPSALNHGLANCSTRYVMRLDADDILLPPSLRVPSELVRRGLDACSCAVDVFADGGGVIATQLNPVYHEDIKYALSFLSPLCHPGTVFDRLSFKEGDLEYPDVECEDYALFANLALKGYKLGNSGVVGVRYRKWGGQKTAREVSERGYC